MPKEDDDDDSLPPLGENTEKFLEDAKKGKARTFLLVCKGTKVKYLAVKKKPVKKSELNEAKKSGYKGEGYFGVLTGKGMELVFNLAIADGYTTEPVKDKILKDFLEEKADFKCKPTILIVQSLPDIPFDEEDLANPLIARFVALGEPITQLLELRPEVQSELKQTTSEIRILLQEGDFKTAEPRVEALALRIQDLMNGAPAKASTSPVTSIPPQQPSSPSATSSTTGPQTPTTPSQTTAPQTVDNDALKIKLQEALDKLVPQLKQAVVTYPERKVELLTPVALIKKQLDTGELQEAKQGILSVGQLLKSVLAQGTGSSDSQPQSPSPVDLKAEYDRKLAALQPNYAKALQEMLGDTNKFRTVMTYAMEQAEAGVYANAIKALDRLSLAIEQAIDAGVKQTDVVREGRVETVSASLQLRMARLDAVRGIGKLESALRTTGDTRAVEIADVIKDVAARFPNHLETLLENLDKANASKDVETANKIQASARSATDDWIAYLKKHELEVVGCEKNPWNLPVSIQAPINNSLQFILTTVLV